MPVTLPVITLGINTFIRYYSMDRSKLIGEISRRISHPGGYDYYRTSSEAARAHCRGVSQAKIDSIFSSAANTAERSNNLSAYECFLRKYGRKRGLEAFDTTVRVALCDGQLEVVVAPQFALESSTGLSVFNIWAVRSPKLDRARAGVGVHLMQRAFQSTRSNYNFKMFDAVEGKTYAAVNNSVPQAVDQFAETVVRLARSS